MARCPEEPPGDSAYPVDEAETGFCSTVRKELNNRTSQSTFFDIEAVILAMSCARVVSSVSNPSSMLHTRASANHIPHFLFVDETQ